MPTTYLIGIALLAAAAVHYLHHPEERAETWMVLRAILVFSAVLGLLLALRYAVHLA